MGTVWWRCCRCRIPTPELLNWQQTLIASGCRALSHLEENHRGLRLLLNSSPRNQSYSVERRYLHNFGEQGALLPGCGVKWDLSAVSWAEDKHNPRPHPNTAGTPGPACRICAWNLRRQRMLSGGELRTFCGISGLRKDFGIRPKMQCDVRFLSLVMYSLFVKALTNAQICPDSQLSNWKLADQVWN